MGKGRGDHRAVGIRHAVELHEMQKKMREALGDGAGSQHLRERPNSTCPLKESPSIRPIARLGMLVASVRNLLPRKVHHAAIGGGNAGPLMDAVLEHFRTADEIAGMPVSKRDLARQRRGVEHPEPRPLSMRNIPSCFAPWLKSVWPRFEDLAPALLENQLAPREASACPSGEVDPPIDCSFSVRRSDELRAGLPEGAFEVAFNRAPHLLRAATLMASGSLNLSRDAAMFMPDPACAADAASWRKTSAKSNRRPGRGGKPSGRCRDCGHPRMKYSGHNRDHPSATMAIPGKLSGKAFVDGAPRVQCAHLQGTAKLLPPSA